MRKLAIIAGIIAGTVNAGEIHTIPHKDRVTVQATVAGETATRNVVESPIAVFQYRDGEQPESFVGVDLVAFWRYFMPKRFEDKTLDAQIAHIFGTSEHVTVDNDGDALPDTPSDWSKAPPLKTLAEILADQEAAKAQEKSAASKAKALVAENKGSWGKGLLMAAGIGGGAWAANEALSGGDSKTVINGNGNRIGGDGAQSSNDKNDQSRSE